MHETPISLLERLRSAGDEATWNRFVELYTPLLYFWARRLGLKQADASDLVQEVFVVLLRQLPNFAYQPQKRFRGWLWTVLVNKWRENERRRTRRPSEVGDAALDNCTTPDSVELLEEAEYRRYLVSRSLELMKADFHSTTWTACWEYVVEGRPAAQVAVELGITINAVHLAKSRVLRRLRCELQGLLD